MAEISLFSGKVKLKITKAEYHMCRRHILRLLISNTKLKISEKELNEQCNKLIRAVYRLKANPNKGLHLNWHRRGAYDFTNKMLKLLPAIDNLIINGEADYNVELILNLGTTQKPNSKHFKLPEARDSNFLIEFRDFLLDYYERNPVFKFYRNMGQTLSLDYIQNLDLDIRSKPLHPNLSSKLIYYQPHSELLRMIKSFPQFKSNKKQNSILTKQEGEFVLKFLSLIRYDQINASLKKDNSIDILGFYTNDLERNMEVEVKQLRNDLSSLKRALEKYYNG